MLLCVSGQQGVIRALICLARINKLLAHGFDFVWHIKTRVGREAQLFAHAGQLFFPHGIRVNVGRAFIGRTAIANNRFAANQAGAGIVLGGGNGRLHGIAIHAVNRLHMPVIGFKALGPIFGVCQAGIAINGYVIVIVQVDQLAQLEMPSQAGGFAGNAFHHVAIAHNGICIVIDDVKVGPVEMAGQPALSHGHAYTIGKPLAQWTGGGFNARRVAKLWMTGCLRAPLAKAFQLLHGHIGKAR